jgi:glycosyltransferase involved in cell wall biosynthesis
MAEALRTWYGGGCANIQMLPFTPVAAAYPTADGSKLWDFIYVADGEAHKNHRTLVEAWIILAGQGLKPSLALTLSSRDWVLKKWVEDKARAFSLNITDLGNVPHWKALELYAHSKALVFPSIAESFGLPLLEARDAGLPILAGELDFVRDVCEPVETFDPYSPVSIARSVRRFLNQPDLLCKPVSAQEFLNELMKELN